MQQARGSVAAGMVLPQAKTRAGPASVVESDSESRSAFAAGKGGESLLAHHKNGWSKRTGHFYFSNFRDSTLKNNLRILRRAKAPLVCSLFSLPPPSFICHRQRSAPSPVRVAALSKQSGGLFAASESLSDSESQSAFAAGS